ncbi:hypothetical protein ARSEF1564_003922 [Beauveria bassiana]
MRASAQHTMPLAPLYAVEVTCGSVTPVSPSHYTEGQTDSNGTLCTACAVARSRGQPCA